VVYRVGILLPRYPGGYTGSCPLPVFAQVAQEPVTRSGGPGTLPPPGVRRVSFRLFSSLFSCFGSSFRLFSSLFSCFGHI